MFGFSFRAFVVRSVAGKTVQSIVTALSLALAAAGLVAPPAHATPVDPVIYDNGVPLSALSVILLSQLSASPSGSFDVMVADSFFLPTGRWSVTDVHWFGGCGGPSSTTNNCNGDSANPLDFNIVFFEDAGFLPAGDGLPNGAAVRSLAIGGETVTATGIDTMDCSFPCHTTFDYSADLVSPLELEGGLLYWLSIQAVRDYPPEWFWFGKVGGFAVGGISDPNAGAPFWTPLENTGGSCATFGCSLAFSLSGHRVVPALSVPEPGTLTLFGAGLLGLGFLRRRRRLAARP